MCEIEDLSLGHQDIYFNKYSDCFVSGTMDLYITDSLQDMLDMDIKSEMATDLGSGTDLSDTLGVSFSDLPPLLDMEMDNATTWIAGSNSSLHNSSNFVHNLDLYGSEANAVMVNPNSVMPSIFSESPIKTIVNQNSSNLMLNSLHSRSVSSSPSPSPTEEKSHLTFSPNTIKVCKVKQEIGDESIMSYGDLEPTSEGTNFVFIKRDNIQQIKKDLNDDLDGKQTKVNSPTIPSLRIKTSQPELVKLNRNSSILNTNQRLSGTQYVTAQKLAQKTFISSSIQIIGHGHQQSRTILANGNKNPTTILIDNGAFNNNKQVLKTSLSSGSFNDNCSPKYVSGSKIALCGEFPKPAYSYSCLIAMALKNSRTGSLPVSEIYNFMCKHFPYFKTAPNGWKNSVRHNLSLNKCFEKIEKPSTNGGQRKGCLWAMNPSKVGKMDEEVQKWSRKDPQAIRKAMVRPDSLEALERGEMKYCNSEEATTADEDCSEDDLDVDELLQPEDQTTDVEVMETTFDEVDIEETIPLKLEFSLASQFHHAESPAKRAKASFLYQAVNTAPAHTNRRKTPLVNRIA